MREHVMKTAWHLITLLVLSSLVIHDLRAQSFIVSRIWLHVWGQFGAVENMSFGNTEISTFGVDSLSPGEFKELEPPPMAFAGTYVQVQALAPSFESIWILPPGRTGQWGSYRGLLRRDWRHLDGLYEARRDTWSVKFAQNDNSSATIAFKWPDPTYLASQCDSLVMYDPTGRMHWPNNRLDMFTIDTLTIPAAGDSFITVFRIFKYGARGTLDARDPVELPKEATLSQAYPNPFNPATKINVQVPKLEFVTLKVFDILGKELATLFEGDLEPGERTFLWNAEGRASGFYLARMSTGGGSSVMRMLIFAR
jgi:hypothetical protein